MARIVPPPIIYCGPQVGVFQGVGGLTPSYPTFQAAVNDLANSADLVGQQIELRLLDAAIDPGVTIYGEFVGQRGPSVCLRASQMGNGAGIIRPSGGASALGLAYGANIAIADLEMDGATQAMAGHPQDVIQLGQSAHLTMFGSNRIIQDSYSYNGITINQTATVDQNPQGWQSPIQNGGFLYWQGQFQAGIQTDNFGMFGVNANGQHGLIAWYMEGGPIRSKPYWAVDFLDCGPGEIHVDGVDFHGTADGYAYRIRGGAILYTNDAQDPNQKNAIPGSARTAWPVQGYIV